MNVAILVLYEFSQSLFRLHNLSACKLKIQKLKEDYACLIRSPMEHSQRVEKEREYDQGEFFETNSK